MTAAAKTKFFLCSLCLVPCGKKISGTRLVRTVSDSDWVLFLNAENAKIAENL